MPKCFPGKTEVGCLEEFVFFVTQRFPKATIVEEDGSGKTYGEIGTLTATLGPDMQADVVGTYDPENHFGWVDGI